MSKSGVIGEVGPVDAGDAKLYIEGFQKGAEAGKLEQKSTSPTRVLLRCVVDGHCG